MLAGNNISMISKKEKLILLKSQLDSGSIKIQDNFSFNIVEFRSEKHN